MCSNLVIILNHISFVSSNIEFHRQLRTVFLHNGKHNGIQDSKSCVKISYESFDGYSTSHKVPTLFVDV